METESAFQLFGRLEGPLNLRLILQPCIAAIFGYLDGAKDARQVHHPTFGLWQTCRKKSEGY